ncbi:MAG TPA: hypothetical protein QF353_06545, partial [Gammaproteobacteria bacterium]|nr:hypothetical protein [Gammaproteobacteria bacterium]
MKDSNKKSSGIEESKDKEGLTSSNQDQPESALQNLVETGETGGPIKKVTGYATLKDLGMLTRVNKKFQSAMNKEIKQRELFIHSIVTVDHTLLLAKTKQGQNKLYAYGKNNYGQLGLGDRRARNEWTEATLPEGLDLEQIIVGYNQSFLKGTVGGEDKLYACGRNRHGQLGLGDNEDRTEWTEVPLPRGFTIDKVMAGGSFAFLTGKISGQDKLYACGGSRWGELGLGDRRARNEWTEATLPEGFKIEEVMAGYYHSFLKGTVDGEDKL